MNKIVVPARRESIISDPVRHAEKTTGRICRTVYTYSPWGEDVVFHTTGEFVGKKRRLTQHCGPTAVTNILRALQNRQGISGPVDTQAMFDEVVRIGQRRLAYWNLGTELNLGGTSYLLMSGYLNACLRRFALRDVPMAVEGRLWAGPGEVARRLRRGELLCLELYRHRSYGSHLVVAYGVTEVAVLGGGGTKRYFLVADGWAKDPRYLDADTLRHCGFVSISPGMSPARK